MDMSGWLAVASRLESVNRTAAFPPRCKKFKLMWHSGHVGARPAPWFMPLISRRGNFKWKCGEFANFYRRGTADEKEKGRKKGKGGKRGGGKKTNAPHPPKILARFSVLFRGETLQKFRSCGRHGKLPVVTQRVWSEDNWRERKTARNTKPEDTEGWRVLTEVWMWLKRCSNNILIIMNVFILCIALKQMSFKCIVLKKMTEFRKFLNKEKVENVCPSSRQFLSTVRTVKQFFVVKKRVFFEANHVNTSVDRLARLSIRAKHQKRPPNWSIYPVLHLLLVHRQRKPIGWHPVKITTRQSWAWQIINGLGKNILLETKLLFSSNFASQRLILTKLHSEPEKCRVTNERKLDDLNWKKHVLF